MNNPYPHEFVFHGVYFSPILVVVVVALIMTIFTTQIFNKLKISYYFWFPQGAFLAIVGLYVLFIDAFLIKI